MLVSFKDFDVTPRYDGGSWGSAIIFESADSVDPLSWSLIETIPLEFFDPQNPEPVDLTTENAQLPVGQGYYKIRFVDSLDNGIFEETEPIFNAGPTEILASINDINAHLDGVVIKADANNSSLVQISIARVVKGYLAKVVARATLATWVSPDTTPDIVREVASMFMAAQIYFNYAARTSVILEDQNFAQRLYTQALAILNGIIDGSIPLVDAGPVEDTESLAANDFFPIDATDRAFTLSLRLD